MLNAAVVYKSVVKYKHHMHEHICRRYQNKKQRIPFFAKPFYISSSKSQYTKQNVCKRKKNI